ncbi:MAG: Uma2 family endonuclease [Acidobacteriaceae bacterium]|nr:Uma2 family endonuclease [Acidobacteriaceae bacterium]
MATAAAKLTVAEFESQYGQEKPYYEYWHGEPVQKSMPTWLHSFLQNILVNLLAQAGYRAAGEVKLKIDPDFQPIPDVVATRQRVQLPYPTTALDVVIEILSESDPHSRLMTKLRIYETWGFEQIYVVDPDSRTVFRWYDHRLEEVTEIATIPIERIWSALDQELS